jgi:hypothetical protein
VLPITINFQPAANLRDNLSQKLGLELWQLFTVLTVIFSLASSFMWLGLVNPRNIADQVNQVDRAKALVYNQYQQDLEELKTIEISQAVFDQESCTVKQEADNSENFKKIESIRNQSRTKIVDELEKNNKKPTVFQSDTNVSKTYKSYLGVLDEIYSEELKLKNFQIKKADLLNKILLICQDENSLITKSDIIDSINEIQTTAPNNLVSEKLITLKNIIASLDSESSGKMVDYLSEVNSIQANTSSIISSLKTKESDFEANTKKIELWERQVKEQNPNIAIKTIYIYDA